MGLGNGGNQRQRCALSTGNRDGADKGNKRKRSRYRVDCKCASKRWASNNSVGPVVVGRPSVKISSVVGVVRVSWDGLVWNFRPGWRSGC